MAWEFDSATPLYAQLASRVRADIVCGVYKKGDKLPAVRELALAASVNPNTMQRAFACLEDEGLVITAGTLGRFVTDDDRVIAEARERIASFLVADFARKITGDLLGEVLPRTSRFGHCGCNEVNQAEHFIVDALSHHQIKVANYK